MTKISVLYPNRKGARFDVHYYLDTHLPRSIKLLSLHPGSKGVAVDRGATGAEPGTDAPYIIMCHFLFDLPEDFLAAFLPHATTLQGDLPNFTDIQPLIQFSDVLLSRTGEAPTPLI
jgi:uncharacterized protein (TIGR02118 family)